MFNRLPVLQQQYLMVTGLIVFFTIVAVTTPALALFAWIAAVFTTVGILLMFATETYSKYSEVKAV
jgi:hypothetical protein